MGKTRGSEGEQLDILVDLYEGVDSLATRHMLHEFVHGPAARTQAQVLYTHRMQHVFLAGLRIRIRRFLGLLDLDPDL